MHLAFDFAMGIILFLILNAITFLKANEIDVVHDVIRSSDKPTSIVAKVCWDEALKMKWARKLSNIQNPRTINFLNQKAKDNLFSPATDVLIVLDSNCSDAIPFLYESEASGRFRKPYRWFIFGPLFDSNGPATPEIKNLSILIDSEVLVATKVDDNYVLRLIYRTTSDSEWYSENFGVWSKSTGLNKSSEMELSATVRRKDLRGLTIVTSLIISDNSTKEELYDFRNILIDTVTKSSVRHITPLYHFMNATKSFVYTDNWGYYINGSWNGMIGHLARGVADLGGTLAFITTPRLAVVEYLSHPTPITAQFVFREPPLSYQHNLFLLPFRTTVWCCIGAFVILLMMILYVNAQWDIKKVQRYRQKKLDCTTLRPDLSDIAIFLISAMSQQGSNQELKGTLGRMVMFILFLIFLFLYTSYSASIVALLQSSSNQIRSLSDLLHSKLELGVEDVPYNQYYFSTATEPIRKAIYETKVAPKGSKPNFMSIEDGVKKLRNEPFAFNMNTGIGYRVVEKYFHEHEKCGLQEIEYIQDNKPWLPCKKNSPFREIYKVGLFRIHEHGLSDRENRLIYTKKPACTARGGNFGSVNMIDFYPVLLLLLYGMISAFVLLFIEILVHHIQMARRRILILD